MPALPADLVRSARTKAGLSQRDLARRTGTAQSVVARIEQGATSPTWETLTRILTAAGFELEARLGLRTDPSHVLSDVPRILPNGRGAADRAAERLEVPGRGEAKWVSSPRSTRSG